MYSVTNTRLSGLPRLRWWIMYLENEILLLLGEIEPVPRLFSIKRLRRKENLQMMDDLRAIALGRVAAEYALLREVRVLSGTQ